MNRVPDLRDRRGQPGQRGLGDPERRRLPRDLLAAEQLRLLVLLRGVLLPLRLDLPTPEQLFRLGHMHGEFSHNFHFSDLGLPSNFILYHTFRIV